MCDDREIFGRIVLTCSTCCASPSACLFFLFNDTATTEIYTLSLHDALPISPSCGSRSRTRRRTASGASSSSAAIASRSEEHTSELQSLRHLVCRLLLEKKKKKKKKTFIRVITHQEDNV